MTSANKRRIIRILALAIIAPIAIVAFGALRIARFQKLNYRLMNAVFRQDAAGVKSLLDSGADANARNQTEEIVSLRTLLDAMFHSHSRKNQGQTALMFASARGYEQIVRLLIDHGANVNASWYGNTALLQSVGSNNSRIVKDLLDRGADIESHCPDGTNALMMSTWRQDPQMMQLLLEKGAKVDSADQQGQTALFFAAAHGFVPHVKLLIQKGADVSHRTSAGLTPLSAAMQGIGNYSAQKRKWDRNHYEAIVKLLKAADAKPGR